MGDFLSEIHIFCIRFEIIFGFESRIIVVIYDLDELFFGERFRLESDRFETHFDRRESFIVSFFEFFESDPIPTDICD